jgi:periplasmic protein TonB
MITKSVFTFAYQGTLRVLAATAGLALTFGLFLVLPLLESITSTAQTDMIVQGVNTALPPPPPPPVEEQKEEEKVEEEPPPPPKLAEETPPLDLSQLELALNPGTGGGAGGDFEVRLPVGGGSGQGDGADVDQLFSMSDLDQKPRVIYQPSPQTSSQLQKLAPGTVTIVFVVDQRGRVENPLVQSSSNPAFEAPALAAVKQWKFEPGKRNGEPVRFRMRVPITFPKKK